MNKTTQHSVLVVCRGTPCGGTRARDAIDMAMAFAAFEQPVTLLFMDDGVFTLLGTQQPPPDMRDLGRLLGTLPDYGIEQVFVDAAALERRGLEDAWLAVPATRADDVMLQQLFATHDRVLAV